MKNLKLRCLLKNIKLTCIHKMCDRTYKTQHSSAQNKEYLVWNVMDRYFPPNSFLLY